MRASNPHAQIDLFFPSMQLETVFVASAEGGKETSFTE